MLHEQTAARDIFLLQYSRTNIVPRNRYTEICVQLFLGGYSDESINVLIMSVQSSGLVTDIHQIPNKTVYTISIVRTSPIEEGGENQWPFLSNSQVNSVPLEKGSCL